MKRMQEVVEVEIQKKRMQEVVEVEISKRMQELRKNQRRVEERRMKKLEIPKRMEEVAD